MSNGGPPLQRELLDDVRVKAQALAASVNAAETGGVPPAVLLPELFTIFQEAGMMPEGIDFGGLLGGLGGLFG